MRIRIQEVPTESRNKSGYWAKNALEDRDSEPTFFGAALAQGIFPEPAPAPEDIVFCVFYFFVELLK